MINPQITREALIARLQSEELPADEGSFTKYLDDFHGMSLHYEGVHHVEWNSFQGGERDHLMTEREWEETDITEASLWNMEGDQELLTNQEVIDILHQYGKFSID